jgi:hypothetical protein
LLHSVAKNCDGVRRDEGGVFATLISRVEVEGSNLRVQGSGFRVQGSGFRV